MMLPILTLILPLAWASWTPDACPAKCTCTEKYSRPLEADLKIVDCEGSGFEKVPDHLPPDTQVLILSRNDITQVNSDQFWPRSLLLLDLSQNKIRSLGRHEPFGQLNQLKVVDLSGNRLTQVKTGDFEDLLSLESLDLSRNRISTIETKAFSNLHKLEILNLARNRLTYIPEHLWSSLANLYELNLSNNHLSVIQRQSLQRLLSLLQLDLSDNRILQIHPLSFGDVIQLEYLKLDGNRLELIPTDALKLVARTLKSLSLSRNPVYRLKSGDLTEMPDLRDISINQMDRLKIVESDAFKGFPKLLIFQLHDNPHLTSFSPEAFGPLGLPRATHFLLHNNNLPVLSEAMVKTMPNLEEISFYGNPVSCDCNARWIRQLMTAGQRVVKFREADRMTCDSPAEHKFRTLSSIDPLTLGSKCGPTLLNLADSRVEARMGDKVTLDCGAIGLPPPKAFWVLPVGSDVVEYRNEGQTIVISAADLKDAGKYTCVAENSVAAVAIETEVTVSSLKVQISTRSIDSKSALLIWSHSGTDRSVQLLVTPLATPGSTTSVPLNALMTSFLLEHLAPGQTYEACLSPSPLTARDPVRSACVTFQTDHGSSWMSALSRDHAIAVAAGMVISSCFLTLTLLAILVLRIRSGKKVVPYRHLSIEDALGRGSPVQCGKFKELVNSPTATPTESKSVGFPKC